MCFLLDVVSHVWMDRDSYGDLSVWRMCKSKVWIHILARTAPESPLSIQLNAWTWNIRNSPFHRKLECSFHCISLEFLVRDLMFHRLRTCCITRRWNSNWMEGIFRMMLWVLLFADDGLSWDIQPKIALVQSSLGISSRHACFQRLTLNSIYLRSIVWYNEWMR